METIKFDIEKKYGKFKILNAVNNGPIHKRHSTDQKRDNLVAYKEARIPYARNHDASFWSGYGGQYSVDITAVFPDFNADVNNPDSYDFACTDEYIAVTLEAGTQTFYRLGQKIEHEVKKHGTLPPKDFEKWAQICEHIIRHYNEKWADGFEYGIEYWEIWNEPDLDPDDSKNKRCWGGTEAQFFDLFEITAKHLKKCFPNLKIGGPALAFNEDWAERFLKEMKKRNVPIDFFSWHIYCTGPQRMIEKSEKIKNLITACGYQNAESILNEWNYVRNWEGDDFVYSIKQIIGMKGAAFTLACMSAAQSSSIDMLMYYDARPTIWNGLFDFYTLEPLKGYYPFKWYGKFYDLQAEIKSCNQVPDIYTLCGCTESGKILCTVTYYSDNDNAKQKEIKIDFGKSGNYNIYLLDETHDSELIKTTDDLTFTMKVNTCIMIEEV